MLNALGFMCCLPTACHFFDRWQQLCRCSEVQRDLAQYLLELTLVEHRMQRYAPSHLAAAAVLLSNKLQRRQPSWPSVAQRQSQLTEPMLKACMKEMCGLLEAAERGTLQAVRKKFSQPKYLCVAKINFHEAPPRSDSRVARSSTTAADTVE